MAITAVIARYVLGALFTVFGLNGFLHFIAIPPKPPMATEFIGMLEASHFMMPVFAIQLTAGLIFLTGRYVPLALTLIAPVLVNILIFHILLDPAGIVPGAIATICWGLVFSRVWPTFAGLLSDAARPRFIRPAQAVRN